MAKTQTRQVATTKAPGVPAHLQDYQSTGLGVPVDQKDFLIPMARVLDAKSPEVTKGMPNYIKGAEAGDIFIKNAPNPIIKGEEGFIFQPCFKDEAVVEWLPRNKGGGGGGGFVASHPGDYLLINKDVCQTPHPENPTKMIWTRKSNKNWLVETRRYAGYAIFDDGPMPLVIPFQSTGHTVAKQWNMLIAGQRLPNGQRADIFLVYYHLTTTLKQRQDQSWYVFDIVNAGPTNKDNGLPTQLLVPTREDADRGRQLYEQLASGQAKIAPQEPQEDTDTM